MIRLSGHTETVPAVSNTVMVCGSTSAGHNYNTIHFRKHFNVLWVVIKTGKLDKAHSIWWRRSLFELNFNMQYSILLCAEGPKVIAHPWHLCACDILHLVSKGAYQPSFMKNARLIWAKLLAVFQKWREGFKFSQEAPSVLHNTYNSLCCNTILW